MIFCCVLCVHIDLYTMEIEELLAKIHESERVNSVLEKKWNELDDDVSKCEDRIRKKYEMLQKRLADEEVRGRQIMEEISGLEVKQKKLYDTEKLLDKIIVYWLLKNRYSDI